MFIIYDCKREVLVDLFANNIYFLVLLFLPQIQQQLACLFFICLSLVCERLNLGLISALHLLEDAQISLMLTCHSVKQGEVIRRVLIKIVVLDHYHLNLFHIVLLVHLECTSVDYILETWLICSSIEFLFA